MRKRSREEKIYVKTLESLKISQYEERLSKPKKLTKMYFYNNPLKLDYFLKTIRLFISRKKS